MCAQLFRFVSYHPAMKTLLIAVLLLASWPLVQDEKKQADEKGPPRLPKLEEDAPKSRPKADDAKPALPETKRKGRSADLPFENFTPRDLVQRFPQANPFLGVWTVTRIARPNQAGNGSGYMIFTRAYVSMHLFLPSPVPGGRPRFQAAMKRYHIDGPSLVATSVMGVRNSSRDGQILIEGAGRAERRRFQFVSGNLLRLFQGANSYIELRRIERL